jgi:hypothetical protein
MTAKKQLNARIAVPLQQAVAEKAKERGETVTHVIETAFQAYIQDGPADVYTPAAPVAVPEGKDAPTGRAVSSAPRTEPEPIPAAAARAEKTGRIRNEPPPREPVLRPESVYVDEAVPAPAERPPSESIPIRRGRTRKMAADVGPGLAEAIMTAEAIGAPLKMASELPSPIPDATPGTAKFLEPGSDAPVIPYEAPEVPDHGAKRGRSQGGCGHYVPAGTKCKICKPGGAKS